MIKKALSLLLACTLIVTVFTACSIQQEQQNEAQPKVQTITEIQNDSSNFKLSYSKSDSLNPFKSKTLNNQIVQNLVFESLFILDESYNAEPQIATSYAYTNSKTLTVTIPSGIQFSDGERLSANSVVNSFNQAKTSPHWKNSLSPITSAVAQSETVIRFNLKYANPYAHNLLTFAIAAPSNDKNGYPIGSGRYKFGEGDGSVYLEVNDKYEGFNPYLTKLTLINITSDESIDNAINIGNISYAFRDMSSGNKTKMQCNKKAVNLNNLVYIGINSKSGITKNEYIRKAISLAVDRDTLVKSAYRGYAKSAVSVFNPSSSLGKQTAVFSKTADISAAKQAIAQSGIKESDLKIDILTNKSEGKSAAALLIKQQLEAAGFKVTIQKTDNKNYQKLVQKRRFTVYIGETKLTNDMNLNSFFTEKGTTSSGIDLKNSNCSSSYNGFLNGSNEIGKFILDFSEEMPFVPLLYRQGMICFSKALRGDIQGYEGNYFSNIEDWYFS